MSQKEKAAAHNGTTLNITRTDTSTNPTKAPCLLEQAAVHLLENGSEGTTRITAQHRHGDYDYRNQIDRLRNDCGLTIPSKPYRHRDSGRKGGKIHLYWLADREQARKAAVLVNLKRKQRGAAQLSQHQVARYLAAFPTSDTTPTTDSHQPTA